MSDLNTNPVTAPAWLPPLGSHADDETIELYVRGKLDEDRANSLEDHYALCRDCQRRIVECQNLVSTMRMALAQAPPIQERTPPRPFLEKLWNWLRGTAPAWAPALAALAIFVTVGSLWWPGSPNATSLEFTLTAQRGPESTAVPAHETLRLKLDRTGLPVVRSGTLVDSTGRLILHQRWKSDDPIWLTVAGGLPAGRYWIRLHESENPPAEAPPAREFGLDVR